MMTVMQSIFNLGEHVIGQIDFKKKTFCIAHARIHTSKVLKMHVLYNHVTNIIINQMHA